MKSGGNLHQYFYPPPYKLAELENQLVTKIPDLQIEQVDFQIQVRDSC